MSFTLKLNINTKNSLSAASLTSRVLDKIHLVNQTLRGIENIEFNLWEEVDTHEKGASFYLETKDYKMEEKSGAKNWEDAIDKVYEKIAENWIAVV